jgi:3-oxoadipate enol-lactonase
MTIDNGQAVIASDGTRLFVSEHGEGEDVLFIPGLGYATWCWHHQVGPISQIARVLLMDNRGAGASDKPEGPYSIAQMADDAYEVLRQRANGPAHVVGTSMGGYIALSLAQRHPDAVRSLILVATTSGGEGAHPVPDDTLGAWSAAVALGSAGFARVTMPLSFAPGWVKQHPVEYKELLALRIEASSPISDWRKQFQACAAFLREGLPAGPVTQPAVIVHGTADRIVPYENTDHLARRLPQASVVTLDGAGHLCWVEQASVFNDIVATVISGSADEVRASKQRRALSIRRNGGNHHGSA